MVPFCCARRSALKPIYQAADAARIELEAFQTSELGRKSDKPVLINGK
jgi:hypothetical protein